MSQIIKNDILKAIFEIRQFHLIPLDNHQEFMYNGNITQHSLNTIQGVLEQTLREIQQ